MILIILRGLPGSGKSTFAQLLGTKAICSADDYFMRNGIYLWDGEKLHQAHNWCQRKCRRFMKKQAQIIIIDNTSPRERDLVPYQDLARQFGYTVYSVIVENRHGGKNVHGVPDEITEKQISHFNIKL